MVLIAILVKKLGMEQNDRVIGKCDEYIAIGHAVNIGYCDLRSDSHKAPRSALCEVPMALWNSKSSGRVAERKPM